ncbi:copper resistance CopC family protein [uncultured Sulfitobacter sp.]|uniref:copper resistance CopC family protein n=1 Tax=uncultured Sulfitobacter sp. TaxID=191468 RepID=UPI00263070F4|nr:copper resistance CopC family protein [uncultured Sulfitobacter sp.]
MNRKMIWVALFTLALGIGQAAAHSKKEMTQPLNGAVLEASPETIAMTFDMPLRVTLIMLTDQDNVTHEVIRTDNMQPISEFSAAVPKLPAGHYSVAWRGLADDGHPMQGAFSFEVSE